MHVVQFTEFGDVSRLHLAERPVPSAHEGTAVIQVEAASVNPSDVKNVAGRMSQTTLPRVSGRDYSGVVVDGPAEWIGREVWGSGGDVGFTRDGTHAEYIEVPVSSLAHKPERLTDDQAACIGVNSVTAWCALAEYARPSKDETVAIIGSTGGVGGAAVQIAKCQRSVKTSHFLEQKTAPRNCGDAGPMGHVERPQSEPASSNLQFTRQRLVPTADSTRVRTQSRDRWAIFTVGKTSHFDHRL